MSDHSIVLIPTDPRHVPGLAQQSAAKSQLALIVADATSIEIEETEGVQLIDCGGNLEKISCPNCSQELDLDWWQDRMDEDFSGEGFSLNLDLVPCCQAKLSLSDLHYQWPMGFARFSITVINPGRLNLSREETERLAQALGSPMKCIYRHL